MLSFKKKVLAQLALNLLVANYVGFVVAQEPQYCEIIDFSSEDAFAMEACETGTEFSWTTYEDLAEEDQIPLLRPESVGLLKATGSFCGVVPSEITFTVDSGFIIPMYSKTPMNILVEAENEENKILDIEIDLTPNDWQYIPLEGMFDENSVGLPGVYKIKLSAKEDTTDDESVYIDFIQVYNTVYTDEECIPRELVDPTDPTDPTTETTEEPTTETTDEPTTEPTDEPTTETTDEPTTEPTDEPTTETTDEPTTEVTDEPTTEETDAPTTEETNAPTTEETDAPTTNPTVAPTDPPTLPEPEQPENEWKVVAAVFISLFCGACVLIMLLIFKPFFIKSTPASSNLVTNEHPMSRTTLPRLQVDSGSSGISGVNREAETSWP
uniref:Uncharacterized protein n=1 Tax=Lutzomyia longipalpis TaxID=7200 RepID=A0A7G3B6G8_LUTLO